MAWITVIVAAAVDGRSIERRRERGEGGRMRRKTALQKAGKGFPLRSGSDATSLNTEEPTPPFLPSFLSRCAIAEPADRIVSEVKVWGKTLK